MDVIQTTLIIAAAALAAATAVIEARSVPLGPEAVISAGYNDAPLPALQIEPEEMRASVYMHMDAETGLARKVNPGAPGAFAD
ncbi:MAG: hypothetical protein RIC18_17135 [Hoeflea sp.]|uniref:hypothetical protein n=1 Tax=Hoeflea sp. TaxID=1940281 RepID=UPI0032ECB4EE